ncbi:polysaccharide biosynthesis/export family protein [Christiangramia sp. SM2212]|uniref:Polysaccharide biosynthesis/export family protein n=1 Tax=Christiangramia sediminicola TaxID=3073267 RepID=A0ABU1EN80_9FLAO|nr:polysaccharide biosynthesis/export family protein [Christiangramia sp. SM2212]MDR5589678.1 polysaccharide biosynthesis/export family protein [Christiangramia sp. SM2212]
MRFKSFLFLFAAVLALTSCVSTKQMSYLQENEKDVDSVIQVQRLRKPYRIQTGDLLSIRVKALDQDIVGMFNPIGSENPNATTEEAVYFDGFTVDDHGNIRVPTMGEINVLGFTEKEVREKIEKKLLEEYFKAEANIFVTVKLAGIRYTTLGEIGEGSRVIYKEQVTIMEAIANAGGITEYGDRENVQIIRQYPQGEEVHKIDVTSINALKSPYYYIQPNDMIVVNPLPRKALGLGTTGLEVFRTVVSLVTLATSIYFLTTR